MGADPYQYVVPYQEDIQAALDALRAKVFKSGDYRGSELNPGTPQEALEMTAEEGTASILDILKVSEQPDFCCAAPLTQEELEEYFGTPRPTVEAIEGNEEFWESLNRGMARYVIIYEGEVPTKIFFAGYSFD